MARNYSSVVEPKTLTANITDASATQITLNNVTGLPSAPYVLVINPDTAKEEVVLVTVDQTGVTSPTLKVQRAIEASGGAGVARNDHTIGDVVKHMIVGSDLQIVHDHVDNTSAHDATGGVVGLTKTQTLTNKTLTTPKINENVNLTATSTELNVLDGITASTAELNYVDGVTSAIQTQINTVNSTLSTLEVFPKGMISPFAGSSAPTGWFLCDGSAKSRTTYSALFAVVSTTYGVGDNSTTFNIPDLRGRTPIGVGTGTGLTARALADIVGVESVTLTALQSGLRGHGHGNTLGINGGDHTHSINAAYTSDNSHDHAGRPAGWEDWASGAPDRSGAYEVLSNAAMSASHSHGITGGVSDVAASAATDAHENMQPSLVVNYIIKH
jgi:microcystin-dependent protein